MNNKEIENKSKKKSLLITLIIGVLSLSVLLLSMEFQKKFPPTIPIEIAMNFGNTDMGQGIEEPAPVETSKGEAVSEPETKSSASASQESLAAVVKESAEKTPAATPKKTKKKSTKSTKKSTKETKTADKNEKTSEKTQPKGDAKGKTALSNLIGGKGKSKSEGQGNSGQPGNIGDPKGSDSSGTGIGENWKSRIPEPQSHDCDASGVIVVDIVVNASGGVKTARAGGKGSTSSDVCLKNKAVSLVKKYVRAYPGKEGRRGSYKVNLR